MRGQGVRLASSHKVGQHPEMEYETEEEQASLRGQREAERGGKDRYNKNYN